MKLYGICSKHGLESASSKFYAYCLLSPWRWHASLEGALEAIEQAYTHPPYPTDLHIVVIDNIAVNNVHQQMVYKSEIETDYLVHHSIYGFTAMPQIGKFECRFTEDTEPEIDTILLPKEVQGQ